MDLLQDELLRAGESTFSLPSEYESRELASMGLSLEVNAEPFFLPGTDSYSATASVDDLLPQMMRKPRAIGPRFYGGDWNRAFKFDGKPSPTALGADASEVPPLTLSDIILPLATVVHSLFTGTLAADDSALLKSMFAKAVEIPSPPVNLVLVSTRIPAPNEGLEAS